MSAGQRLKKILPYLGIPVLGLTLLLIKGDEIGAFRLFLMELLLIFGYVAAWVDFRQKMIPNKLVLAMLGAWVLIVVPQLFFMTADTVRLLLSGILGFVIAGVIFLLVYWVSRKGLGGGDVKLMAVMGLYLGFRDALSVMLIGSVLMALVGVVLILMKRIERQGTLPLAPFLYIGVLVVLFTQ